VEITNNKKLYRFEAQMPDGEFAVVDYRWLKGNMVIMHTLVPASGRGKGVGSDLVKYVLDYLREHNLKAIIYCPFASKYVSTHPEYNDVIVARPKV
jgi:predicted GNAT family acetyltransferase